MQFERAAEADNPMARGLGRCKAKVVIYGCRTVQRKI